MKKTIKMLVTFVAAVWVATMMCTNVKADEVYCPTTEENSNSFFKVSGSISKEKGTLIYANKALKLSLKMEKSTLIEFTNANPGKLVIVVSGADTKGFNINVDGNTCDGIMIAEKGCVGGSYLNSVTNTVMSPDVDVHEIVVDVAAGSHTITKKDTTNIYYMTFVGDSGAKVEKEPEPTVAETTKATTTAQTTKATTKATTTAQTTKAAVSTTKAVVSTTKAASENHSMPAAEHVDGNNNVTEETSAEATSEVVTEKEKITAKRTKVTTAANKEPKETVEDDAEDVVEAPKPLIKEEEKDNTGAMIAVGIVLGIIAIVGIGVFVFVKPNN